MVDNRGNAIPYIGGTGSVPLPAPSTAGHHTGRQAPPKPAGLDWDALKPTCTVCARKSSTVNRDGICDLCGKHTPTTPGVKTNTSRRGSVSTFVPMTDDQLRERFTAPTSIPPTLTADLEHLEATDPNVAAAAAALDTATERITRPIRVDATSLQVEKRPPTVRAKVKQVSPHDVLITLRSLEDPLDQIAVARLLSDLLAAYAAPPQSPAPDVATRGTVAPSARSGAGTRQAGRAGIAPGQAGPGGKGKPTGPATPTKRGRSGGRNGKTGALNGHDHAIITRYQAGETTTQIAADYDVSRNAIAYLLRRNNIPRRHANARAKGASKLRALTPELEAEAVAAYAAGGVSMATLARRYGCSENAIRRILHAANVPIRKPSTRITKPTTTGDTP